MTEPIAPRKRPAKRGAMRQLQSARKADAAELRASEAERKAEAAQRRAGEADRRAVEAYRLAKLARLQKQQQLKLRGCLPAHAA